MIICVQVCRCAFIILNKYFGVEWLHYIIYSGKLFNIFIVKYDFTWWFSKAPFIIFGKFPSIPSFQRILSICFTNYWRMVYPHIIVHLSNLSFEFWQFYLQIFWSSIISLYKFQSFFLKYFLMTIKYTLHFS